MATWCPEWLDKIANTDTTLLDFGFCFDCWCRRFCLISFNDMFAHDAVKISNDNSIPLHHDLWGLLLVVMAHDDVSKLTKRTAYCCCIRGEPQAGNPVDDV